MTETEHTLETPSQADPASPMRHRRTALLLLLLLLSAAPARAQSTAEGAVGALLDRARERGTLARVLAERTLLLATADGAESIVTARGEDAGDALRLTVREERLASSEPQERRYELARDGTLRSIVVARGAHTLTATRRDRGSMSLSSGEGTVPWSEAALPTDVLLFVVAPLLDAGLPADLRIELLECENLREPSAHPCVLRARAEAEAPGLDVLVGDQVILRLDAPGSALRFESPGRGLIGRPCTPAEADAARADVTNRDRLRREEADRWVDVFRWAVDQFRNDVGRLPARLEELWVKPTGPARLWVGPYVIDPPAKDPWGQDYLYVPGSGGAFELGYAARPGSTGVPPVVVGQRYVFRLHLGDELVYTVREVLPDVIRYEVRSATGSPTVSEFSPETEQEVRARLPAGTTFRRERLTVTGFAIDCLVYTEPGGESWIALAGETTAFPGRVRAVLDGDVRSHLIGIERP